MKRLTPVVPGEIQPVMLNGGRVITGFVSGGKTDGRGFPQWVVRVGTWGKSHFYLEVQHGGAQSLCGLDDPVDVLWHPGNYPRCTRCAKALAVRRKHGLSP